MNHLLFLENPNNQYKIAILIKSASLKHTELKNHYVNPLINMGIAENDIIAFDLKYNEQGKCPVKLIKAYLSTLLKALDTLDTKTLLVADSAYFKTLTKSKKTDPHYGSILPCAIPNYEHINVILTTNYSALFYNPGLKSKLDMSLNTLTNHMQGTHTDLGTSIIHSEYYPDTYTDIAEALKALHQYSELTCDIEAFSLKFNKAGIGTIAFAWNQHEGVAFTIDYKESALHDISNMYGHQIDNRKIKKLLLDFFVNYKGKLIYHNVTYDIKVIIYELFMNTLLDNVGLISGLESMYRNIDDTKVITYLATNTTAGNKLGLKENVFEFAGNYAKEDIKDIRRIPKQELLKYNLVDCLSTWYVKNKNYPSMVKNDQLNVYNEIMLPSLPVITHMELTGMPLDMEEVHRVKKELSDILWEYTNALSESPIIMNFTDQLREEERDIANSKLKVKIHPLSHFVNVEYNPGSSKQTAKLLHNWLDYEVIDTTDTGLPATGAKTIKKHLVRCEKLDEKLLLKALIGIAEVSIILSTFIESFIKNSVLKEDDIWYLHGNFNLNGTKSGRLSSSKPNLQNIPSTGSRYAGHIKKCFMAPSRMVMAGADYDSLEDKISALTTKDPNKIKVYTDNYDGHCLRAFGYFKDELPGIVNTVDSINSIKKKFPKIRQKSKEPTFALTYQGTWHALVNDIGMSEEEAKSIEKNYHIMYKHSDDWVQDKLILASKQGYVTLAFGLRLRTPILHQALLNKRSTPYAAQAESRTAGNALGQSYGLLNNRSAIEFHKRLLASPYKYSIKPIAHIHDAQYFIIEDTVGCVKWFNDNLIECMQWQELPEIQHDGVKLGGSVDLFYPNWSNGITLPNKASKCLILDIARRNK